MWWYVSVTSDDCLINCESSHAKHSHAIKQGKYRGQLPLSWKVIIARWTSVTVFPLFWMENSGRVVCKRRSHNHWLHDKSRWPRDAKSISFLMIGKSWFPDWNEYGKDLYPPVESRSPLISCPWGAYQELFTRCKWYLLPCSILPSQQGGTWHEPYHLSSFFKV